MGGDPCGLLGDCPAQLLLELLVLLLIGEEGAVTGHWDHALIPIFRRFRQLTLQCFLNCLDAGITIFSSLRL